MTKIELLDKIKILENVISKFQNFAIENDFDFGSHTHIFDVYKSEYLKREGSCNAK